MMYTGSCPHCGKVLRGGHGDPMKRIGSPLCSCPHCGGSYLDENMYEWEVLAPESQLYYYFIANSRWALYVFSFIGAFALNHWLFFLVFVFIAMLLCYGWVHTVSYEDIEKSKVRCTSQGYLDMLVQVGYSKMDQRYYDQYKLRKIAESSEPSAINPPPSSTFSEEPVSKSVTVSSSSGPGYSIGRIMWFSVNFLCHQIGHTPSLHLLSYIWAAYLYFIAKSMRSQALVDEIYSEFQNSTESYFADRLCGADSFIAMQNSYRRFRTVLNESRIDPRTDQGMTALWYILSQWAFPDISLPENSVHIFKRNCNIILSFVRKTIEPTTTNSPVRFSISDSNADCSLPENS